MILRRKHQPGQDNGAPACPFSRLPSSLKNRWLFLLGLLARLLHQ
jgi:hypothetical protein